MILLIDNYDSFSYNLFQLAGSIRPDVKVVRNDEVTVEKIKSLDPGHIVISPGPGRPEDAGVCVEAVKSFAGRVPILGVCLGHQAICEAFGTPVTYAKAQMHGKTSEVRIMKGNPIFEKLPDTITVGRYHSLAADSDNISDSLRVIGRTDDGEVMAVCHRLHKVYGLQFHPESILTPDGETIMRNFLRM
ncbi:MAG: aminodeoxychorismate/anthranilate synthase component II [Candidatus Methanoplasma sp.]|jgi:anthranilate synthase component 2|nr:aminodeoxychorismate/anthranilate synthase component II [Candidatus Methanoplasma sp.]